jgi:alcohol dehydrogenase class IV
MTARSLVYPGSFAELPEIIRQSGCTKILLLRGKSSFEICGAAAAVQKHLREFIITEFSEIRENPLLQDALKGAEVFRNSSAQLILAIGGGSVMDTAKLIKMIVSSDQDPEALLKGEAPFAGSSIPLIAVPTTAGTGSEATHFAVVYIDKTKYSVAHSDILPNVALVDADFSAQLPPYITACTGADALGQAMESLWNVHSTTESREYALKALPLILTHLPEAVQKASSKSRAALAEAAWLAGRAINITKTTAPHAISYTFTSYFGLPHGHGVAMTLGAFLRYNFEVNDLDCNDPRGPHFVQEQIAKLFPILGTKDVLSAQLALNQFFAQCGIELSLKKLNIDPEDCAEKIQKNINLQRLANNPRKLSDSKLRELILGLG